MKKLFIFFVLIISSFIFGQTPALEFALGDGNPTSNGPVQSTTIRFRNNTDNPTGNTFITYEPALTATFQLTNQQYSLSTISTGYPLNFGFQNGSSAGGALIFDRISKYGSSDVSWLTSYGSSGGSGINTNSNYGVVMNITTSALRVANAATSGTAHYLADLEITFSRPVNNPILHIAGMGSKSIDNALGFSLEYDFVSAYTETNSPITTTLTRLSGSNAFSVTGNNIRNSATIMDATGTDKSGSGSVRINSKGVKKLIFKVSVRGDGSNVNTTAWSREDTSTQSGEGATISFSLETPPTQPSVSGTVYLDTDGDANINGTPTNGGGLYINAVGADGKVVASKAVAANGTFTIDEGIVTEGNNYTFQLSKNQGIVGQNAPAKELNIDYNYVGESTSTTGNDGTADGSLGITIGATNISGLRFGILKQLIDSDGDGIPDVDDLDDDNDGILDTDECPTINYKPLFHLFDKTPDSSTNGLWLYKQENGLRSTFVCTDGNCEEDTSGDLFKETNITGSVENLAYDDGKYYTVNSAGDLLYTGDIVTANFTNLGNAQLGSGFKNLGYDNGVFYHWRYDTSSSTLSLYQSTDPVNNGWANIGEIHNRPYTYTSNGYNYELKDIAVNDGEFYFMYYAVNAPIGGGNNDIRTQVFSSVNPTSSSATWLDLGSTYYGTDVYNIAYGSEDILTVCDTDGDGIPDYLDLDSDNDGCPDAIEGAGDFTSADLTTASGDIASQTPNLNFGIDVDGNGIPIKTGSTGQGVGSSKDDTVNGCIVPCPAGDTPPNAEAKGVDIVILLDNSYSVSNDTEWPALTSATNLIIDEMLACNPDNRAAVVHYAGELSGDGGTSTIWIESDFSSDAATVKNFQRRGGDRNNEGVFPMESGAYTPEAVRQIGLALDGVSSDPRVFSPQKTLTQDPENKLVVFILTDGLREGSSPMVSEGDDPFAIYNEFKTDRDATFVITSLPPGGIESETSKQQRYAAAAAIASVGGTYTGGVEANPGDPEGSQTSPRRAVLKDTFDFTSQEILDLAGAICSASVEELKLTNSCPENFVNLNDAITTTPPNDTVLVWFDGDDPLTANQIQNPETVETPGSYYAFYYDEDADCYSPPSSPVVVTITECTPPFCYKDPATSPDGGLDTKVGITTLGRAGDKNTDQWPMARKGGWLALESSTKGFVVNRVSFTGNLPDGIDKDNYVEGMMVYDTTNKCLKVYTLKEGDSEMGWHCMDTQTCPD